MRAAFALDAHRFLLRAALASAQLFSWIFVFQLLFDQSNDVTTAFVHTLTLYAFSQVVTILVTPYAAQLLASGVRRMACYGVITISCSFVLLSATIAGLQPVVGATGLILFAAGMGLYRALYFVPYSVEMTQRRPLPKNVPAELFIGFMPAIAAVAMENNYFGALVVLCSASFIALISLAPLTKVSEIYERFSWGYRETFGELLEPRFRLLVFVAFLEGFESATLLLLWPLFVFLFIAKSYTLFGLILSATLIIAIPARSLANKLIRNELYRTPLVVISWVLRLVTKTPFGVIFAETFTIMGKLPGGTIDLYAKEHGADNSTYVDELTALKEMSAAFGRLSMTLLAAALTFFIALPIGIAVSCIVAAGAAVLAQRLMRTV